MSRGPSRRTGSAPGGGALRLRLAASTLLIALLSWPDISWGQCTAVKPGHPVVGDAIGLQLDAGVPPEIVDEAIALWSACRVHGEELPLLGVGELPGRRLTIRYARASKNVRCGSFQGAEITVYGFARDGLGRPVSCQWLAQIVAHELGHAMGLRDAPGRRECRHHIMAQVEPDKPTSRRASREECRAVAERWRTASERAAGGGDGG